MDYSSDRITIADDDSLDVGNNSFTIEAWVKPRPPFTTGGDYVIIFYKKTGAIDTMTSTGYFFSVNQFNMALSLSLKEGASAQTLSAVNDIVTIGVWNHVVAVVDASNSKMYINGVDRTFKNTIDSSRNVSSGADAMIGYGGYGAVNHENNVIINEVRN